MICFQQTAMRISQNVRRYGTLTYDIYTVTWSVGH